MPRKFQKKIFPDIVHCPKCDKMFWNHTLMLEHLQKQHIQQNQFKIIFPNVNLNPYMGKVR